MYDSNGAESTAIEVDLEEISKEEYVMTIKQSLEWLSEDARVFPIVIAPSIVKGAEPISFWEIDFADTTTVADHSGNANNLSVTNAQLQTDISLGTSRPGANYYRFDGNGDYLSRAYDSDYDFGTGSFSISLWANVPVKATEDTYILMSRYTTAGYKLYLSSDNICFGIDADSTWTPTDSVCEVPTGTSTFKDASWHHIAPVKSGTSSITLYIDGIEIAQDTSITSSTASNFYDGKIDEVRIYNYYTRTPAQIAWEYNRGAPIAWYRFDECSGTTIKNWAKNANGGLLGSNGSLTIGGLGSVNSAGTCSTSGAWYNGAAGKYNASMDFDGTDDYVSLGSPVDIDDIPVMTLTAWIRPDTFGESSFGRILDKDSNATSGGFSLFIDNGGFCSGGGNRLAFSIPWSTGPNGRGSWCSPANSISTGEWIHVAMSYNRSSTSNDPIFYINGNIVNVTENETPSGTVGNDSENNLYVGNRPETDRSFDGLIDDLRIYNYVLTPVQIKEIMNFGSVSFQ